MQLRVHLNMLKYVNFHSQGFDVIFTLVYPGIISGLHREVPVFRRSLVTCARSNLDRLMGKIMELSTCVEDQLSHDLQPLTRHDSE